MRRPHTLEVHPPDSDSSHRTNQGAVTDTVHGLTQGDTVSHRVTRSHMGRHGLTRGDTVSHMVTWSHTG